VVFYLGAHDLGKGDEHPAYGTAGVGLGHFSFIFIPYESGGG